MQSLLELQRDCAPIRLIVFLFVGRALTSQRQREYEIAVHQARTRGVDFADIRIINDKFGSGGKADTLQELGVHILRSAQRSKITPISALVEWLQR